MSNRQQSLQFLTRNELIAILDRAKLKNYRNYVMLLLAYRHGLRASETVNITIDSIDLDAKNIHCKRGKGSISNWQALGNDEVKAIKCWQRKRPKCDSPYLFVSDRLKPISRIQFYNVFRKLAREIGLPSQKQHPHILKHSLGTHLANSSVPLQVIQQRLGHRNIQSTMLYLSISSGYVDKMMETAIQAGAVV